MLAKKEVNITSATGSGWSNIPACYDKSDTSSATVVSGQGQELSLSVNTLHFGDIPVDKVFFGNDVVDSIYLGDNLVYGK